MADLTTAEVTLVVADLATVVAIQCIPAKTSEGQMSLMRVTFVANTGVSYRDTGPGTERDSTRGVRDGIFIGCFGLERSPSHLENLLRRLSINM